MGQVSMAGQEQLFKGERPGSFTHVIRCSPLLTDVISVAASIYLSDWRTEAKWMLQAFAAHDCCMPHAFWRDLELPACCQSIVGDRTGLRHISPSHWHLDRARNAAWITRRYLHCPRPAAVARMQELLHLSSREPLQGASIPRDPAGGQSYQASLSLPNAIECVFGAKIVMLDLRRGMFVNTAPFQLALC